MINDYTQVGGKRLFFGTEEAWNFGWVGFESDEPKDETGKEIPGFTRTKQENEIHANIVTAMPSFQIQGQYKQLEKVFMWETDRLALGGKDWITYYQQQGSCVGNGWGQALQRVMTFETVRLNEPEEPKVPFWLLPYGKGRELGGMNNRGDGSFGSVQAEAGRKFGTPSNDSDQFRFPEPEIKSGGLTWGSKAELDWSVGRSIPREALDVAANHLIKTTATVRSADDAAKAIQNHYPMTIASGWGGQMQCQVQDGVLLNRRSGTWQHQMCVIGWWDHSSLGEIFYILNSWSPTAHGKCPTGAPEGGFWVKKADMDWICRNGECYALSQFDGYPAQSLDWLI